MELLPGVSVKPKLQETITMETFSNVLQSFMGTPGIHSVVKWKGAPWLFGTHHFSRWCHFIPADCDSLLRLVTVFRHGESPLKCTRVTLQYLGSVTETPLQIFPPLVTTQIKCSAMSAEHLLVFMSKEEEFPVNNA